MHYLGASLGIRGIAGLPRRRYGARAGVADFREEGRAEHGGCLGRFGTAALLGRGGFGFALGQCCSLGLDLLALTRRLLGLTPRFLLLEAALFLPPLLFFGTEAFFGLARGPCGRLGLLALGGFLLGSELRFLLGVAALLGCSGFPPGAFCLCCRCGDRRRDQSAGLFFFAAPPLHGLGFRIDKLELGRRPGGEMERSVCIQGSSPTEAEPPIPLQSYIFRPRIADNERGRLTSNDHIAHQACGQSRALVADDGQLDAWNRPRRQGRVSALGSGRPPGDDAELRDPEDRRDVGADRVRKPRCPARALVTHERAVDRAVEPGSRGGRFEPLVLLVREPNGIRAEFPEQLEHWRARDPIMLQQARLQAQGVDVEATRNAVAEQLDAALARALQQPLPDPASATEGVFCEGEAEPLGDGQAPYSGYAARGTDRV